MSHIPPTHQGLHVLLHVSPFGPDVHPFVQLPLFLSHTLPIQCNGHSELQMSPQKPDLQLLHCPLSIIQFGSLQSAGHLKLQAGGPQYPSTHPSVQFPTPSQTLFLQVVSHPKSHKLFKLSFVLCLFLVFIFFIDLCYDNLFSKKLNELHFRFTLDKPCCNKYSICINFVWSGSPKKLLE